MFFTSHKIALLTAYIFLCIEYTFSSKNFFFISWSAFHSAGTRLLFTSRPLFNSFYLIVQGLAIISFNNGNINPKTIREVLSVGPTYFVMKFFKSNEKSGFEFLIILLLFSPIVSSFFLNHFLFIFPSCFLVL